MSAAKLKVRTQWLPDLEEDEEPSVIGLWTASDEFLDRAQCLAYLISEDRQSNEEARLAANTLYWLALEAREFHQLWWNLWERSRGQPDPLAGQMGEQRRAEERKRLREARVCDHDDPPCDGAASTEGQS
ncbi:MAG: hypothetical protein AB7I01_01940 [Gammaproteobacteria bacterium]